MFQWVVLIISLSVSLTAQEYSSRSQVHMGTVVTISLPAHHFDWIEAGFERFKAVENALSSYRSSADIYRLNREHNISIGSDTYNALRLSERYWMQTEGYFDITVGAITKKRYRFGADEQIPTSASLQSATLNFSAVYITPHRAVTPSDITLDLGGMGKGFGVDAVAALYRDHNITSGVIAAGGDIRCLDQCDVAIQNPFDPTRTTRYRTRHRQSALSTSGNYNRYVGTVAHNHLIDPKRKRAQQTFASITLVSTSLRNSDLDAYATAASVMPIEQAIRFLNNLELAYVIITTQKERLQSAQLSTYLIPYPKGDYDE